MTLQNEGQKRNLRKAGSNPDSVARAEFDRDSLKSIFHILVGKPDSTTLLFEGPFQLGGSEVADLHDQISRKIRTHSVETLNASAFISSSDRIIHEFSSMKDLLSHPWSGSEQTESVTLKWDFLINMSNYEIPQRHTLTVRVARLPNAKETLRRIFSDTSNDDDPHDMTLAPMYCRADFISPILGKELINIVKDWHKGLKRPIAVSKFLQTISDRKELASKAIEYSIPFTVGVCGIASFRLLFAGFPPTDPVTVMLFEKAWVWGAAIVAIIYIATLSARTLAHRSLMSLATIETNTVAFTFTNGDSNLNQKVIDRSNKRFRNFLVSATWAIVLNILATYLAIKFGIGSNG